MPPLAELIGEGKRQDEAALHADLLHWATMHNKQIKEKHG